MIQIFFCFLVLFSVSAHSQSPSSEEIFSHIYEKKKWGVNEDKGCSGGGSSIKATVEYRQFLECLLMMSGIQSVVDAGCGEWEFSKKIDWTGIDYCGYDVVRAIIEKNQKNYGNEHIRFMHADILSTDLPPADLLICKDLLQHWTNADVSAFSAQFPKYKYCLITNDVDKETKSSRNSDIQRGESRTIDLTQPPFNLEGKKVFTYMVKFADGSASYKQVFLIINSSN